MKSNAPVDRNFDDLTEKFKRKVYGGLKGEIRLAVIWRDLNQVMALKVMGKPIRILDIGGGLGQLSTNLSLMGHQVSYNDIVPKSFRKQPNHSDAQSFHLVRAVNRQPGLPRGMTRGAPLRALAPFE